MWVDSLFSFQSLLIRNDYSASYLAFCDERNPLFTVKSDAVERRVNEGSEFEFIETPNYEGRIRHARMHFAWLAL